MTRRIMIIGATSGIAEAVARSFVAEGAEFFLVARDESKLESVAADLRVRGASKIGLFVMDTRDLAQLEPMLDAAWSSLGTIDVALVAHGSLPDQALANDNPAYLVEEFRTNAESAITCLSTLAKRFEPQHTGTIAVMGSVAGDRGRKSNYLYGSAKAAVDAFASGLRARLFQSGVHVITIKPGFVATAMTAKLNLPSALTAMPQTVARQIHAGIVKKRNVIYTPRAWRWILLLIRMLPESVFKRLSI